MTHLMTDLIAVEPLRGWALASLMLGALLGGLRPARRQFRPVPVRVRRR